MKILVFKTKRLEAMAAAVGVLWAVGLRAGLSDLRITEVDPSSGRVEVTHAGATAFTTASSLPFCHRFNYFSTIPAGTTFGPGESRVFMVGGLSATDSDLWLYRDANFLSAASIISGLKYGPASNVGRTSLAVSVGLWPSATAFLPAPTAGQSLQLTSIADSRTTSWFAGPPNFGTFEPAGIAITQVTDLGAAFELEFTSPFPAGSHRVELRRAFGPNSEWSESSAVASNTVPGRLRVTILKANATNEFIRIKKLL